MMQKNVAFMIILCLTYSSCQNKLDKTLQGGWTIDYLNIKNIEYLPCLSINVFRFKDEIVKIPQNLCDTVRGFEWQDESCQYTVTKKDEQVYFLTFHTDAEFFNDTFKMVFFKNEKEKLLKLYLASNDKEMVIRKGFFNFDRNIKTINALIKETGGDDTE